MCSLTPKAYVYAALGIYKKKDKNNLKNKWHKSNKNPETIK